MAPYKRQNNNLAPLDPDVKIPAAIRAAAAKAESLHQQEYTPAPTQDNHGQERQPEEAKPSATTEEVKEPAKEVPAQVPATGGEDYEHRYNSLKGRYDKQDDVIRSLTHELGSLRSQIETLRTTAAPAPVQRTNENSFKKLTDEEREAYGSDFIDVSARAAEEKLMPEIVELRRQLAELGGKVETTASSSKEARVAAMWEKLDRNLPSWRKINREPKFLAWVNLRDPFSGAIRIDMLKQAFDAGEGDRVLHFFNGFLRDEAVVDPDAAPKADVTSQGKVPLESLAAPGRAKASAASPTPGEKETISRSQITEFYRLVNSGHYRGNEAEKDALEQRIFQAQAEGRVV